MQKHPDFDPNVNVCILSVGTKILLKDTMDQYLRTLGNYRTYYSPTMQSALRTFSETSVQVLITEVDLVDGSAYQLIRELGGSSLGEDDLYTILATEERSSAVQALADELEVNSLLVKPFTAVDLKLLMDSYLAWRELPKDPWRLLVREGQLALKEKQFRMAEEYFVEAIKTDPNHYLPLYKAALFFLQKPDFIKAETLLKKALDLKPNFAPVLSALGNLYASQGDLSSAEEFLKNAESSSPLNPEYAAAMGQLYIEKSVEAFRHVLRVDPSNRAARVELGKLLAVQKQYIPSLKELERVTPFLKDKAKLEAQTFMALSRKLGNLAK